MLNTIQNLLKSCLIATLVIFFASACKKDVINDLQTTKTSRQNTTTNSTTMANFGVRGDNQNEDFEGDCEALCFDITFPVTVNLPSGTTQTATNEEELETIFNEWYNANPDSQDDPTVVFPIEVTLQDGTTRSIADETAFEVLLETCFGENEWEECFTINYPITVIYPDGTTAQANNNDELGELFIEWETNNPDAEEYPNLGFPIEVTLQDGGTQSIADEGALDTLFEDCFGDWDDGDWDEGDYDGDEIGFCFDIVYPVTVLLPDGTSQTANSDEDLDQIIMDWFANNPDDDESFPTLAFPIDVNMDGETFIVNNETELVELFDQCEGNDEDGLFEDCFTFSYPITIIFPDSSTIEINSDEGLETLIDTWYEQNPGTLDDPQIVYPVNVILLDGTVVTVNSNEEIEAILENCYDCEINDGEGLIIVDDKAVITQMTIQRHAQVTQ